MNVKTLAGIVSSLGILVGAVLATLSFFATAQDLQDHEQSAVQTLQMYQHQMVGDQIEELEDSLQHDELSPERRSYKERKLKRLLREDELLVKQIYGDSP